MNEGHSTRCGRLERLVMVRTTRAEWQNIRCITIDCVADACSAEGTCLREATQARLKESTSSWAPQIGAS